MIGYHSGHMTRDEVVAFLKSQKNDKNIAGMARFGISSKNTLGINIPVLRALSKKIGTDHDLAQALWETEIHEARILTGMIADPQKLTSRQMDLWVKGFDSWDVCDGMCMNCFYKSPLSYKKAKEWAHFDKEFVRRAGFSMIAVLAFKAKTTADEKLLAYFPLIKKYATDERNFVRKAVNWALRQIGKRNKRLHKEAIALAHEIKLLDSKSARWIANDALRELKQKRL